jgi:hypothetical protein
MVVRLSALRTRCTLLPRNIIIWFRLNALMRHRTKCNVTAMLEERNLNATSEACCPCFDDDHYVGLFGVFLWRITMGSQKVPGMLVLHCNGRTYGNSYLVAFKVGPFQVHTLAPSILPLLVATADVLFWNLPEFGCPIRFGILHGYEKGPVETHFQSREQPKVTENEVRRLRWLGDDRNVSF